MDLTAVDMPTWVCRVCGVGMWGHSEEELCPVCDSAAYHPEGVVDLVLGQLAHEGLSPTLRDSDGAREGAEAILRAITVTTGPGVQPEGEAE